MAARVNHRRCAARLQLVLKHLSGASSKINKTSRVYHMGTEVTAVHLWRIARVTIPIIYQAHQSRRRDSPIQFDTDLEEVAKKLKKCRTESLKEGEEDDVARSRDIQIAREITTYRDIHDMRYTRDIGVEDMLVMQIVGSLITVVREVDTPSCKVYGQRFVEFVDCSACES